jgi:hypothetical protein
LTTLDEAMVQELLDADLAFIAAVQKALADFDAAPPGGWQEWESWRKPDAWRNTVLPNLERYREGAEDGLREIKAGNPRRAFFAAQGQMGLSKKIEFDSAWASPAHQQAIADATERVSAIADRIWRIGHAQGLATP